MSRRRVASLAAGAAAAALLAVVLVNVLAGPGVKVRPLRLCTNGLVPVLDQRFCTHGGDPDDANIARGSAFCLFCIRPPVPTTTATRPACADAANPKGVQLVYAHPSDQPDVYTQWLPTIRSVASQMDQGVAGRNIRWVCTSDGQLSILRVTTPPVGSDARYTFADYITAIRNVGGTSSNRAYLGFVSGVEREYPYGGQGTIRDDDQTRNNANDVGPMYSMVDRLTWTGALHELGHNLGAVQCSAPHSSCDGRTGHHHCWDENDIMCYDDGGSHPLERRCDASTPIFDCNHDDYWNTQPVNQTYLATHWNLARSSFTAPE